MQKFIIKVLIDGVWNHTSDKHPWFVESRKSKNNPKPEINLSKEQISDRLSQEIQTNILQQGFDVVSLINVSVLSKPTVEDRITNAR